MCIVKFGCENVVRCMYAIFEKVGSTLNDSINDYPFKMQLEPHGLSIRAPILLNFTLYILSEIEYPKSITYQTHVDHHR